MKHGKRLDPLGTGTSREVNQRHVLGPRSRDMMQEFVIIGRGFRGGNVQTVQRRGVGQIVGFGRLLLFDGDRLRV